MPDINLSHDHQPVPIENDAQDLKSREKFSGPFRDAGSRDYAPSVMYDVGKIVFIGGGLETVSMP
jgi:hypothetical protein